ncbi:MAG: GntR family transcriptional regulator [Kiritimatiellae bacterium]|nr:GntR family transcriptional regulator [Kiritimatiellia bacterium]
MTRESPRVAAVHRQLSEQIAQMAVGVPLPPVSELMRNLTVSQRTIEKAYEQLQVEGLILRRPGKGVFVADRAATGEMAIVVRPKLLDAMAFPYYQFTITALTAAIAEANPHWRTSLRVGRDAPGGDEFSAMLDLVGHAVPGALRGVFTFHPLQDIQTNLTKARIPVVLMGGGQATAAPNEVWLDRIHGIEASFRHLKTAGCRSVAVLGVGPARWVPGTETNRRWVADLAGRIGLETRSEWMPVLCGDATEDVGWELFKQCWEAGSRPDGVYVDDDVLCRGVLRAIAERRLSLPADLRLVTAANRGIPLPYQFPVTRYEFDPAEQARVAVRLMTMLVRGQTPPETCPCIQGQLVQGATT